MDGMVAAGIPIYKLPDNISRSLSRSKSASTTTLRRKLSVHKLRNIASIEKVAKLHYKECLRIGRQARTDHQ